MKREIINKETKSEFFNSVLSIIKKLPLEKTEGDCFDRISAVKEIERLIRPTPTQEAIQEERKLLINFMQFLSEENALNNGSTSLVSKFMQTSNGQPSDNELLNAVEYGYNYHSNSQFPEKDFESNCKNNALQWIENNQPSEEKQEISEGEKNE